MAIFIPEWLRRFEWRARVRVADDAVLCRVLLPFLTRAPDGDGILVSELCDFVQAGQAPLLHFRWSTSFAAKFFFLARCCL